MNHEVVNIIGGGYAGTEAALTLAGFGVEVHLFSLPQPLPEAIPLTPTNKALATELLALGVSSLEDNNLENICKNNEKKLNLSPKIMIFDKKVSEISLQEPTIIATGKDTDGAFLSQIEQIVGKHHVVKNAAYFPEFKGKILGIKDGDSTYLPLTRDKLEEIRHFLEKYHSEKQSIEKFAKSGEQIFRVKVARAVLVKGKVYDCSLKLKKVSKGWRLVNFQTELDSGEQDKLFAMIDGLKNAKVTRYGSIKNFTHLKSFACLNPNLQSRNNPNIFFAGALIGVEGELEAIASGHLAALNILNMFDGLTYVTYPKSSIMGKVLDKLFSNSGVKNEQILESCDIIEKTDEDVISVLKKFKENYNARISRHNDMCGKKRW